MKFCTLIALLFFALWETASGQLYPNRFRPAAQQWQELRTDHFRLLFPAGHEDVARRSAFILEREYPNVREMIGGDLKLFPVILNGENDRSGGFVSPINFRSEVEVSPHRGKTLNPRSGGWLEQVLPHELVHALHMSSNPASASSLVGLISPDLRRSIHMAAPIGVHEGVAVYYETRLTPYGAGRGNHPYFTGRSLATGPPGSVWSMGQLFHRPGATRPFDRHYIGSYEFTEWLYSRYGQGVMREAVEYHYKWPFLGFGFALRHATGRWPSSLHRLFLEERDPDMSDFSLGSTRHSDPLPVLKEAEGAAVRRPLWIDEERILMHASFYDAPTGFYLYNLREDRMSLVLEQRITEDYRYVYLRERNLLWFSNYLADGRYDQTYRPDLFTLDPERGRRVRITHGQRLTSPSPGRRLLALRSERDSNTLVEVTENGLTSRTVARLAEGESVEEVLQHPLINGLTAIIARKGAAQAIWINRDRDIGNNLKRAPNILFSGGTLYDLDWHPVQKRLLFSSDHEGSLNIYEYDLDRDHLYERVRRGENSFEASYSPDGRRIVFILQQGGRSLPVVEDIDRETPRKLPPEEWKPNREKMAATNPGRYDPDGNLHGQEEGWTTLPYHTGLSWIRPRALLPSIRNHTGGYREIGLSLLSTDLLSRHSYSFDISHMENRLWLDLDYTYSGFYPGFGVNLFHRPRTARIGDFSGGGSNNIHNLLTENRGGALYIPFRYTFEQSTRLTQLHIRPEYQYSIVRLLTADSGLQDQAERLHNASVRITLRYRLRQFTRDVQPNAGWVFLAGSNYNLHSSSSGSEAVLFPFQGRRGIHAGFFTYLAPLQRWNQSMRIGVRFLTQSESGPYDPKTLFFTAFQGDLFPDTDQIGMLDTRYTIPLAHPDDGGLLLPVYLERLYLVLFSQTALRFNPDETVGFFDRSRTLYGTGIRVRARLSNLSIDLGIGVAFEPTRSRWSIMAGDF